VIHEPYGDLDSLLPQRPLLSALSIASDRRCPRLFRSFPNGGSVADILAPRFRIRNKCDHPKIDFPSLDLDQRNILGVTASLTKQQLLWKVSAMRWIGRLTGLICVIVSSPLGGEVLTQEASHPEAGLALARRICSDCHAVERKLVDRV
jgi:hypothetical protein